MLAGNGSNELIEALLLVTVGAGTRVVIPEPTFTLYALLTGDPRAARSCGCGSAPTSSTTRSRSWPAPRGNEGAALTIVCSPNNPTGSLLEPAGVESLCRETRRPRGGRRGLPRVRGAVGGAPARAAREPGGAAHLLQGHGDGRVCASAICWPRPRLVREINKARLPYNLNFFSQVAALAALRRTDAIRDSVRRLRRLRDELMATLGALPGSRVHPSHANFFLLELHEADPKGGVRGALRAGRAGARRDGAIRGWSAACASVSAPRKRTTRSGRALRGRWRSRRREAGVKARRASGARRRSGEGGRTGRTGRVGRASSARRRETDIRSRLDLDGEGRSTHRHRRRLPRPHAHLPRHPRPLRPRRALQGRPARGRAPHGGGRGHRPRRGPPRRRSATRRASCASATPTCPSTRRCRAA